jgi:hypothetical protein
MKNLKKEIEVNFDAFDAGLKSTFTKAYDDLAVNKENFLDSYQRRASLQAWKAYVLEQTTTNDSLNFFIEAQNDAILSHCFAKFGSWRASLQSLRSALENILFYLYYKDHNVELSLWQKGKHSLPILDYITYVEHHPNFINVPAKTSGLEKLKIEYGTLSRSVHASSAKFRMTKADLFPAITLVDPVRLNQWLAREEEVLRLINQLLITMFVENVQGSKLRNLRKTISLSIPSVFYSSINEDLGVKLYDVS